MDDEGDELEDLVKEENEVIEKMGKLEKVKRSTELEMEVADLRGRGTREKWSRQG